MAIIPGPEALRRLFTVQLYAVTILQKEFMLPQPSCLSTELYRITEIDCSPPQQF